MHPLADGPSPPLHHPLPTIASKGLLKTHFLHCECFSQLHTGTQGQQDVALSRTRSPGENVGQSGPTSAAVPNTVQPILPSAMATEERNSSPRNAKPQPKPKANRAGGQQGRVSMRYVTVCCTLLNSKHLATKEQSPKC